MSRRLVLGPLLAAVVLAAGAFIVYGVPGIGVPGGGVPAGPTATSTAGAALPSATAIPTPSASPTPSATPSASPSATPTTAPSPSPSLIPSPSPSPTASAPAVPETGLQGLLDGFLRKYRIPGGSVTITYPDGRTWTGSSGFANVATGRRVTARTAFAIASMSKTFTGALILGFVERGRLRLDDRVARLLPSVRLGTPGTPIPPGVTVRMLLDHTSGLADYFFGKGVDKALNADRGATWTAARALSFVGPATNKPGAGWHYSNTNYLLLGLIAERLGHASAADQIRARFLDPLGLKGAFIQGAETPTGPVAHGYTFAAPGTPTRPADLADARGVIVPFTSVVTAAGPAGFVAATTTDLAAWARALYGGSVLRPETLTAAVTDSALTAKYHPYVRYGLGVQVTRVAGQRAYGHSGRFAGVRGELRYLPEAGMAIAIVVDVNSVDLQPLVDQLMKLALTAIVPSPAPALNPRPFSGR